ncbi:MAG TPA: hypothetical protein VKB53_11290 [Gammaproteobacteria bacterium]|jgi:hypothetical protein|nr:hypothetical protein [Gammaproteobacteria bacterium]HKH21444.1 hypothetical protein [Gammaproteobacteria bacterium]
MKERLILGVALGLAVAAAQAFTADQTSETPASPADLLNHSSLLTLLTISELTIGFYTIAGEALT